MSEYNHDCGSCSANCDSRKVNKGEFLEVLSPTSFVERVTSVINGKGGMGKPLVTSIPAVSMNRKGKKAAVLDADITGPSIPVVFGIGSEDMTTSPDGSLMLPAKFIEGVEIMSASLLLGKDTDPAIRRDPVTAGAVKQFWSETLWWDVDYIFVDMPPDTGDVPLTIFQSLPVDDIIIVTLFRELMGMVVAKAMNMAKKMDIPIVGVVENISYLECPGCSKRISVFGEDHVEETAAEHGIKVLAQMPVDPTIVQMMGAGRAGYLEMPWFSEAVRIVEAL